jgi:ABC-type nitrate/sulfonate/bicarbonate transport system ATPase subunit
MLTSYEQKETLLYVENLSIVYGDKVIISNINFSERDTVRPDRPQGQTIAFVGRSGRGKSTLFRALTGLENPTKGVVLIPDYTKPIIDGKQPAKKVIEGDVGFVDQKYTLFRHKTIYQSLRYALRKTDLSSADKDKKILAYLKEWGLTTCRNQFPNELSGGQRQRTAILEQLLSSGSYIVLDEPFSGLDVGNIQNVKDAFKLINESSDLNTIIFSTHDIELAVELADSLYVIGYGRNTDGSLSQTGTILKNFDLKQLGLAWSLEFTAKHLEVVKEIKDIMLAS